MTTPDIEKLRGLLAEWRTVPCGHTDYQNGREHQAVSCANDLEAAGLPELLADYERLTTGEVKGNCDYCHKPVTVRMGEAWRTKGDKVWHEVCSYQEQIVRLNYEQLLRERG